MGEGYINSVEDPITDYLPELAERDPLFEQITIRHLLNQYDIITHIRTYAGVKGIYIDYLNGHSEHLHALLLLQSDHTLSFVMQLIKGESSYWINRNHLTRERFEKSFTYYQQDLDLSVSESDLPEIREFISNQDEFHKNKTWEDEYYELLEQFAFSDNKK